MHPDNNEFAPVRLTYDPEAKQKSATGEETINIIIPQYRTGDSPNDPIYGGNVFGVVEQRVATVLGPMLGKGLIRTDAKIRRGASKVSCSCTKSLITVHQQLDN
jgi:SWI/SNF-related matrix-associated actin-dependent regulator of chromatin subfamily A3